MNKEIVEMFLDKGYLISPEVDIDVSFTTLLTKFEDILVITEDIVSIVEKGKIMDINWNEFERARALFEKNKDLSLYRTFLELFNYDKSKADNKSLDDINEFDEVVCNNEENLPTVIVLKSFNEEPQKREMRNFVDYFKYRYSKLRDILRSRIELQNVISINRLLNKNSREIVSLIGLVNEKKFTKNGNILLNVEDITGNISVLLNKDKEIFNLGKDIVEDEVIGVNGVTGNKIVFANSLFFPDIPLNKEFKKCNEEVYAIFTADLHTGSNMFQPERFSNFIKWINCETGDKEQKNIAKKVKYLFIVGDLIDGIGIYPEQDKELCIKDVKGQYDECARFISCIRKDVKIVICAGNHDALRIAEPQPILKKEYAQLIWELPNVVVVSNPGLVNIHSSENFPGFDVLLYHGYSFDYYIANVDSIRNNGGYDRADLVMKFLLQKRHLAPTHSSTLYVPGKEDPLLIEKVPDFFVSAHVHHASMGNYNNVTTICCGCWQSKTSFQEKTGHEHIDDGKVHVVNLNTREVKVLEF